MHKDIKDRYVSLLRSVDNQTAQLRGAELIITDEYIYMDAYAVLAALYMSENDCLVGFVPLRGTEMNTVPEFYFYLRADLVRWSGLTDEELAELIRFNDELEMDFISIANAIDGWE